MTTATARLKTSNEYGLTMRLDLPVRRLRRKDQEARAAVRSTLDG